MSPKDEIKLFVLNYGRIYVPAANVDIQPISLYVDPRIFNGVSINIGRDDFGATAGAGNRYHTSASADLQ